jgi:type IV secretion system protein VirB9
MILLLLALAAARALPPLVAAWSPDALVEVAVTPGRVTDIVLEPGERLAAVNPVAAGDTARWILGQTESGQGAARQAHVLVKPVEEDTTTNLVIVTDRRTYRLELKSTASAWTPTVSWRYPVGALVAVPTAVRPPDPPPARPAAERGLDPATLNFAWTVKGRARFRPERVFDDGRRTYIDLPRAARRSERPLLFVRAGPGPAEAVAVREAGGRLVADRVFARGELRLGKARVTLVRGTQP